MAQTERPPVEAPEIPTWDAVFDPATIDGVCLCSSVPALVRSYEELAQRWAGAEILVLGPGVRTGIPIRYDDPREVGPDRIANAVAAVERHGRPCIVVDFGTSTNFDVVSPAGEYVGGVLAPGIEISMDALFARAARLVKVDFVEPPSVIGKTTVSALQSGLVYGFAGQVDGIVSAIRGELGVEARAVATGGLADLIAPHSRTIDQIDVFTLQDTYTAPVEPTAEMLSTFGVRDFAVQYWTGNAWVTVPGGSITGNRHVRRISPSSVSAAQRWMSRLTAW